MTDGRRRWWRARLSRDAVSYLVGLWIIVHEVARNDGAERPALLGVALVLVGGATFVNLTTRATGRT